MHRKNFWLAFLTLIDGNFLESDCRRSYVARAHQKENLHLLEKYQQRISAWTIDGVPSTQVYTICSSADAHIIPWIPIFSQIFRAL